MWTPTGETPFNLTYGTKVVILVEVGLTSLRREFFDEQDNNDQLKHNLDLVDKVRDQAAQRMAKYKQKIAEYYNRMVKLKKFNIGDLVLRKVTPAMKDSAQGKLGSNWEGPYRVIHYLHQGSYHLEDAEGKRLPHPWNVEHLKRYFEKES